MAEYHCLLQVKLPSFPFSRDCISVWKRTEFVEAPLNQESDLWANIPLDERLPDVVAPCLKHLIEPKIKVTSIKQSKNLTYCQIKK